MNSLTKLVPSTINKISLPNLTPKADGEKEAYETARHRGYTAGYSAGARKAEKELEEARAADQATLDTTIAQLQQNVDNAVKALAAATAAVSQQVKPVVTDAEDALAQSALDLAEAIIGRELRIGKNNAQDALDRVLGNPEVGTVTVIRMNPADIQTLGIDNIDGTKIVADPKIMSGDAIAELPVGYLDARVSTSMQRAREALEGEN